MVLNTPSGEKGVMFLQKNFEELNKLNCGIEFGEITVLGRRYDCLPVGMSHFS